MTPCFFFVFLARPRPNTATWVEILLVLRQLKHSFLPPTTTPPICPHARVFHLTMMKIGATANLCPLPVRRPRRVQIKTIKVPRRQVTRICGLYPQSRQPSVISSSLFDVLETN